MRRTPMQRTPFQRKNAVPSTSTKGAENKPSNWPESHSQQALLAIISIVKMQPKNATSATTQAHVFRGSLPKSQPVRSEAYRRVVASLPCIACGIQGYSQAAHLPPDGKGIKQGDDLIFPLCCVRVGVPGCHQDYDQYRLFNKQTAVTVGRAWAADTQRRIYAMRLWPKGVPYPHDQQDGAAQ